MKDIYENRQWNSSNVNKLESSTIHSYLNSTFLNLFDSNIKDAIKQVKIPYRKNGGSGGTNQSGANGLSCKIFLLSGYEVGWTSSDNQYFPQDGAKLSYFESGTGTSANNKRIAELNGSTARWWLRSPGTNNTNVVWYVYSNGNYGSSRASYSTGIRPALILPSTYELDLPYDLTVTIPKKIKTGDILNCPYSGSAKSITLPKGQYKLECWGAQGGTYSSYKGGPGGYSVGNIILTKKETLFFYVGGAGTTSTAAGFNGGGTGINKGRGGGGASDIRIGQDSLYARVIVAGGGGGAGVHDANTNPAGCGGGLYGGDGYYNYTTGQYITGKTRSGGSASQTEGGKSWRTQSSSTGTFGKGGNASGYSCGGGGGGWYGGGGAYDNDSDSDGRWGGGGSGYVYTSSTASNYPSGCLLNSSYYLTDAQTIAGNTAFTSPTGTNETGHAGNGYIRITVIKADSGNTLVKTDSTTWKNYKNIFINTGASTTVPSGLVELEYLESSGTQYIDTGFLVSSNNYDKIKFVVDCDIIGKGSGASDWLVNGSNISNAYFYIGQYQNKYYYGCGTTDHNTNTSVVNGRHTFTLDTKNKKFIVSDVLGIDITIEAVTATANLYLCGFAYTAQRSFAQKLYGSKIYQDDVLVRDFIPCKNPSGVIGLYDKVTKTFYPNAGTGTFMAGPAITLSGWHKIKGIWAKTAVDTWSQAL